MDLSSIVPGISLSYKYIAGRYSLEPTIPLRCIPWMMCPKKVTPPVPNKVCPFLMIKSLKILVAVMLATVLLFMVSTGLTYRMGVPRILNQTLNRTLLVWPRHKDLVAARPFAEANFNRTLVSLATIELGEVEEKQKIDRLLDGTYDRGRMRSMSTWRKENYDSYGSMTRGRRAERPPIQFFHPRYSQYWPEFRRSLQAWVRNKRLQPQVMRQLQDLVKTPLDRHYSAVGMLDVQGGKPYRSCAVVGNSGILLQKKHGSLIDGHEMVIRLNNAKVVGFADNVGTKTTLAFVNSNILHSCARRAGCFCHPYGEAVPIIMYICQAIHFMDFALCNASHKAPLLVTDARFDSLCARIVKYYSLKNFVEQTGKHPEEWSAVHDGAFFHYSSGMQAVMLALGICERVSIFGFGKSSLANHHYHTNQKAELKLHDYAAEYLLYDDLVNGSQHIPFLSEAGFQIPPVQIYV